MSNWHPFLLLESTLEERQNERGRQIFETRHFRRTVGVNPTLLRNLISDLTSDFPKLCMGMKEIALILITFYNDENRPSLVVIWNRLYWSERNVSKCTRDLDSGIVDLSQQIFQFVFILSDCEQKFGSFACHAHTWGISNNVLQEFPWRSLILKQTHLFLNRYTLKSFEKIPSRKLFTASLKERKMTSFKKYNWKFRVNFWEKFLCILL